MPCSGVRVELFAFDTAYVERLRAGDPLTEKHFVAYFEQLVQMKTEGQDAGLRRSGGFTAGGPYCKRMLPEVPSILKAHETISLYRTLYIFGWLGWTTVRP